MEKKNPSVLLGKTVTPDQGDRVFTLIANFYEQINKTPEAVVRQGFKIKGEPGSDDYQDSIDFACSFIEEWTTFPSNYEVLHNGVARAKSTIQEYAVYNGQKEFYQDVLAIMKQAKKVRSSIDSVVHYLEVDMLSSNGTISTLIKHIADLLDNKDEIIATITLQQAMFTVGITPIYDPQRPKG